MIIRVDGRKTGVLIQHWYVSWTCVGALLTSPNLGWVMYLQLDIWPGRVRLGRTRYAVLVK